MPPIVPPIRLLNEAEAAEMLNVSVARLRRWRQHYTYGLKYLKLGATIRYRYEDLQQWLRQQAGKVQR